MQNLGYHIITVTSSAMIVWGAWVAITAEVNYTGLPVMFMGLILYGLKEE